MPFHVGDIRVETGSKQQINIFMVRSVMEKYRAGQGRSRTLFYYNYFDFVIFQRLTKASLIGGHLKVEWKEGRVEAIWLSGGRRNVCKDPGVGVLGVCEKGLLGSQRSEAKEMTHEGENRAEREEERSGGGQSKAEKRGRGERHREEGRKAGTGGLRATVNTRAFTIGEMVLSRGGTQSTCVFGELGFLDVRFSGISFLGEDSGQPCESWIYGPAESPLKGGGRKGTSHLFSANQEFEETG